MSKESNSGDDEPATEHDPDTETIFELPEDMPDNGGPAIIDPLFDEVRTPVSQRIDI